MPVARRKQNIILHLYPWPEVSKVPVENLFSVIDKVLKNIVDVGIKMSHHLKVSVQCHKPGDGDFELRLLL